MSPNEPAITTQPLNVTAPRRPWRSIDVLGPIMVSACVIALWYFMSYVGLSERKRFLLPAPHQVVTEAFLDMDHLEPMLRALGRSALVAGVGLTMAIVIGVGLAVLMSQRRWVERSIWPYAVALQCVPVLAVTPLIGALLGFSFTARVVVTFMIALFPIIANTLFGILDVSAPHHDLFTLQRVSRWTRFVKLELPSALPAMLAGFRISAGLAVIGSVVGDVFFRQGKPGIGALIDLYRTRLQGEEMIASIILAAALGLTFFGAFGLLTRILVGQWHEEAKR